MDRRHLGEIDIVGFVQVAVDLEGARRQRRRLIDAPPAAGRGALAEGGEAETIARADGRAAETGEIVVAGAIPGFRRVDAVAGVGGFIGLAPPDRKLDGSCPRILEPEGF